MENDTITLSLFCSDAAKLRRLAEKKGMTVETLTEEILSDAIKTMSGESTHKRDHVSLIHGESTYCN